MSKQKGRLAIEPNFFQSFLQDPLRYVWGLGGVATVFVILGLCLHFFWGTKPQPIPFIEGVQGPLRIRPAMTQNQPPSRRIYGDLSFHKSQKPTESVLPPEETPELIPEASPILEPLLPSAEEPQRLNPSEPPKKPSPPKIKASSPKETLPSLDALLKQVEEMISEKKSVS